MAELHAKFDKLDSLHGEVHWSGGTEERLQEEAAHARTEVFPEVVEEDSNLRKEIELIKKLHHSSRAAIGLPVRKYSRHQK